MAFSNPQLKIYFMNYNYLHIYMYHCIPNTLIESPNVNCVPGHFSIAIAHSEVQMEFLNFDLPGKRDHIKISQFYQVWGSVIRLQPYTL